MTVHDLIAALPEPDVLAARCRAFAVLDAVFDSGYPTYSHTAEWAPKVALAEMSNGSGDLYAIVFEPAGVFLYGFDHESEATPWRDDDREHWPGLLEGVPDSLVRWTREPAFLFAGFFDATVCAWRETDDTQWRCGPVEFDEASRDPDGADHLFGTLVAGTATAYADYARDYFECDIDVDAVATILDGRPLTAAVVAALNPDAAFTEVAKAAIAAGYPVEAAGYPAEPEVRS
ncbi:hypothetical protein KDL01_18920 [Actinospica durhamensis]|uniref:Uncharacterized protein n=1 Tax=Actinospica durhamensis TaxID=1508375 RepID=A0A941EWR1_9ACTN|nr:hypothetical protein [Actinospica durhamensis]MBR7835354.1 hypothetical protein [Actinospica durhamensis]